MAEEEFSLSVPFNEGLQAKAEGNYDKAIESFRKVLFVDGSDSRTQFLLAESLLKAGDQERAFKEFNLFLRIVKGDKRLKEGEKKNMIQTAEEVIRKTKIKSQSSKLLSFFDWNVLIITFFLSMALLFRLLNDFLPYLSTKEGEESKLKELFVERYWERTEEKEITGIPPWILTISMFALLIIFYFLTFRIFQRIF